MTIDLRYIIPVLAFFTPMALFSIVIWITGAVFPAEGLAIGYCCFGLIFGAFITAILGEVRPIRVTLFKRGNGND